MLLGKVWYFFSSGSTAFILPYFNVYFADTLHFSKEQIGAISALRPWLSAPCSVVLCSLADRFKCHTALLVAAFTAQVFLRCALMATPAQFMAVALLVLVGDCVGSPVGALVDATVVSRCSNDGEYGKHRLWGSIGWGGLSVVAGSLVAKAGLGAGFAVYAVMSVPCVFIAVYLRKSTGTASDDNSTDDQTSSMHTRSQNPQCDGSDRPAGAQHPELLHFPISTRKQRRITAGKNARLAPEDVTDELARLLLSPTSCNSSSCQSSRCGTPDCSSASAAVEVMQATGNLGHPQGLCHIPGSPPAHAGNSQAAWQEQSDGMTRSASPFSRFCHETFSETEALALTATSNSVRATAAPAPQAGMQAGTEVDSRHEQGTVIATAGAAVADAGTDSPRIKAWYDCSEEIESAKLPLSQTVLHANTGMASSLVFDAGDAEGHSPGPAEAAMLLAEQASATADWVPHSAEPATCARPVLPAESATRDPPGAATSTAGCPAAAAQPTATTLAEGAAAALQASEAAAAACRACDGCIVVSTGQQNRAKGLSLRASVCLQPSSSHPQLPEAGEHLHGLPQPIGSRTDLVTLGHAGKSFVAASDDSPAPLLSSHQQQEAVMGQDSRPSAPSKPEAAAAGAVQQPGVPPEGNSLRSLLMSLEVAVFMWRALIIGLGLGTIGNFLFLHIEELGGTGTLLGLMLAANCCTEVPAFHFQSFIMSKYSVPVVFNASMLMLALRLAGYGLLPWLHAPWAVLGLELLHGVTFATSWGAGIVHCKRLAPPHLNASMQGVFASLYGGVGSGLGALLGGILMEELGGQGLFLVVSLVVIIGWFIGLAVEMLLLRPKDTQCQSTTP